MPYISEPYRAESESSLIQRIRSSIIQVPIADTHGRQIDLAPWPEKFDHNGVVTFRNNGRPEYARLCDEKIKPDIVIFATGYRQTFPFLTQETTSTPYPTPETTDTRSIWHSSDPSVAFIGFIRPSFGAIPPLSELQAQVWILRLIQPSSLYQLRPEDEPQYKLKQSQTARIQYGVDHESYAYQLAVDMGAAVSFCGVVRRGWRESGGGDGAWYKLRWCGRLGRILTASFGSRGRGGGMGLGRCWSVSSGRRLRGGEGSLVSLGCLCRGTELTFELQVTSRFLVYRCLCLVRSAWHCICWTHCSAFSVEKICDFCSDDGGVVDS